MEYIDFTKYKSFGDIPDIIETDYKLIKVKDNTLYIKKPDNITHIYVEDVEKKPTGDVIKYKGKVYRDNGTTVKNESIVIADVVDKDMPVKDKKKKKCKRKEKFKTFMTESTISFDDDGILTKDGKMVDFGSYGVLQQDEYGSKSQQGMNRKNEKEFKKALSANPGGIAIWNLEDGHKKILITKEPTPEQFRVLSYIVKSNKGKVTQFEYRDNTLDIMNGDTQKLQHWILLKKEKGT
jgi:hypothetical protein